MRVVVFTSENDGSLARIEVPAPPVKKGEARVEYLPVAIHAATPEAAVEKAEAFFKSEQERLAKQEAHAAARIANLAAARARKSGAAA